MSATPPRVWTKACVWTRSTGSSAAAPLASQVCAQTRLNSSQSQFAARNVGWLLIITFQQALAASWKSTSACPTPVWTVACAKTWQVATAVTVPSDSRGIAVRWTSMSVTALPVWTEARAWMLWTVSGNKDPDFNWSCSHTNRISGICCYRNQGCFLMRFFLHDDWCV